MSFSNDNTRLFNIIALGCSPNCLRLSFRSLKIHYPKLREIRCLWIIAQFLPNFVAGWASSSSLLSAHLANERIWLFLIVFKWRGKTCYELTLQSYQISTMSDYNRCLSIISAMHNVLTSELFLLSACRAASQSNSGTLHFKWPPVVVSVIRWAQSIDFSTVTQLLLIIIYTFLYDCVFIVRIVC